MSFWAGHGPHPDITEAPNAISALEGRAREFPLDRAMSTAPEGAVFVSTIPPGEDDALSALFVQSRASGPWRWALWEVCLDESAGVWSWDLRCLSDEDFANEAEAFGPLAIEMLKHDAFGANYTPLDRDDAVCGCYPMTDDEDSHWECGLI